jgi:hypothetical protein
MNVARQKTIGMRVRRRREALALKIAPWLTAPSTTIHNYHFHSGTGTTSTQWRPKEMRP